MSNMKVSQNGINFIKSFEGCSLKAYKPVPTEKHWTIGYGHYGSDVRQGQTITLAEAEDMLKRDLQKYVDGVNRLVKVQLNQNQFDVLVSFAYNCGVGALQKSDLLGHINQGNLIAAANEFEKWVHGGGKVLPGLVRRRNDEKHLFLTKCDQVEGEEEMFKPTSKALNDLSEDFIENLCDEKVHGEKALDKSWLQKYKKGELTTSDAIAITFAAAERGLFASKRE